MVPPFASSCAVDTPEIVSVAPLAIVSTASTRPPLHVIDEVTVPTPPSAPPLSWICGSGWLSPGSCGAPEGMTAVSSMPGTPLGDQLAGVSHAVEAPPAHV